MAELKSTLLVINEAQIKSKQGPHDKLTQKGLVGNDERPTERLFMNLNDLEVGTHVALHWHPIEALYYVVSGRAIMTDIEGKTCEISAGSVIYATPGIASAHEWEVTERMRILVIRATRDPERRYQFIVDKATKMSYLDYDALMKHGGAKFKSLY